MILLLISLHTFPVFTDEPDYYRPESVKAFADWLYATGDYKRSAGEYLRYFFMLDKTPDDGTLFRIGLCYSRSGEYDKAITTFGDLITLYPESAFICESRYETALIHYRRSAYAESLEFIAAETPDSSFDCRRFHILAGIDYLYLRDWHAAYRLLHEVDNTGSPDITGLLELSESAMVIRGKNPFCAGVLSALVPGLGKMYAGKPGDGLFSLLTIGIFGGMAAYGFYEEGVSSVKAWIYASIGGIFYLGNIYGSVNAAIAYTREREDDILRKVDGIVENFF